MTVDEATLRTRDLGRPEPSADVLDRLVASGHARNGFCEKCWSAAYSRAMADTSKTQTEHYFDLLAAAEQA